MSKIVRIGDKYYDFETKNESFLLTAKELKTLGIKNWYICLEVKYPQLGVQDLDPWSDKWLYIRIPPMVFSTLKWTDFYQKH